MEYSDDNDWELIQGSWYVYYILFVYLMFTLGLLFVILTSLENNEAPLPGQFRWIGIVTLVILLIVVNLLFPMYIYLSVIEFRITNNLEYRTILNQELNRFTNHIKYILHGMNIEIDSITLEQDIYLSIIPKYFRKFNQVISTSSYGITLIATNTDSVDDTIKFLCFIGPINNKNMDIIRKIQKEIDELK